ncbi:MAG: efflux RND transporter periplasmic adaptor subunit [Pirellulales bacterium]
MRNLRSWVTSILLLVGVSTLATGCNRAAAKPAPAEPPKVTVSRPTVRDVVDEDEYGGWLRAAKTVEVRARVRGHIDKIHFQDGDFVEKDQLLFELDPRPFQVQIDETVAAANALKAQQLASEKDLARNRELARKGAVTQQELEKSEADALSFAARYASALQQSERYKLDLEYARVTAPIAGRIGRAMLTEGNLVNAGGSDPLLTTIVSVDPIFAYFTVDERSLQRYLRERRPIEGETTKTTIRERQMPLRFALDSDEGFPHEGVLDFADNQVDSTTGTIEVRGVVANPRGQLVAGSRIRVRVASGESYSATLVPDEAILADQEKRFVLVLGPDNIVLRRDIQPGRLLDDGFRIVRGADNGPESLKKDDWIIINGLQRARVNYPVTPLTADGQPLGNSSSNAPSSTGDASANTKGA